MNIQQLPKLELHCHLDGSLVKTMMERYLGRPVSESELTVSDNCSSLTEYLEKFDLPLQCLQDEKGLEEGAYAFVEDISKENVQYIEVRFAPMLSVHDDLSCGKVIEAVRKGMERGREDFGVRYGIIVCAMRSHTTEQNMEMLRWHWIWQAMSPCIRHPDSGIFSGKPDAWKCRTPYIPERQEVLKMSEKPMNFRLQESGMELP